MSSTPRPYATVRTDTPRGYTPVDRPGAIPVLNNRAVIPVAEPTDSAIKPLDGSGPVPPEHGANQLSAQTLVVGGGLLIAAYFIFFRKK